MQFWPFNKDKKLGVANNKGRYDLPLNQGASSSFLILLIALMTFLTIMALAGGFALNGLSERWSSGLENKATVEVPALKENGKLRSSKEREDLQKTLKRTLSNQPVIKSFDILEDEQIEELVTPWLGESFDSSTYPLPMLISLELHSSDTAPLKKLKKDLKTISPDITLDTHEAWLTDILKLAGSLKLSAMLITLVIALTTVTAIAGAIRARMAEHKDDVELLHLMGASDSYITQQFQKHALILTFKGATAGLIFSLLVFGFIGLLSGTQSAGILPDLSLSLVQAFIVLCIPAISAALAWLTARFTVTRVLALMP